MAYKLKDITIRTNNSDEGIKMIDELWGDIVSGKLPLLFDSEHILQKDASPISKYSNYSSDERGDYDLTIMNVTPDFFEKMEMKVRTDLYKKYDERDEDGKIDVCAKKAWEKVWSEQKLGDIKRAFSEDYEITVPSEYAKDGNAHCYLYISVQ